MSEDGSPQGQIQQRRGGPRRRPMSCRVCTILIGEGYAETQPVVLPNDQGVVCWRCYESLRRQAERRASQGQAQPPERRA